MVDAASKIFAKYKLEDYVEIYFFCIDAILNGNYDTSLTLKTKLYLYWTKNTSNIHRFGCFSFYYVMLHLHGLLRPLFLDLFLHGWLPLIEMQRVCLTPFGYLFCQTRTGLAPGPNHCCLCWHIHKHKNVVD